MPVHIFFMPSFLLQIFYAKLFSHSDKCCLLVFIFPFIQLKDFTLPGFICNSIVEVVDIIVLSGSSFKGQVHLS